MIEEEQTEKDTENENERHAQYNAEIIAHINRPAKGTGPSCSRDTRETPPLASNEQSSSDLSGLSIQELESFIDESFKIATDFRKEWMRRQQQTGTPQITQSKAKKALADS